MQAVSGHITALDNAKKHHGLRNIDRIAKLLDYNVTVSELHSSDNDFINQFEVGIQPSNMSEYNRRFAQHVLQCDIEVNWDRMKALISEYKASNVAKTERKYPVAFDYFSGPVTMSVEPASKFKNVVAPEEWNACEETAWKDAESRTTAFRLALPHALRSFTVLRTVTTGDALD